MRSPKKRGNKKNGSEQFGYAEKDKIKNISKIFDFFLYHYGAGPALRQSIVVVHPEMPSHLTCLS